MGIKPMHRQIKFPIKGTFYYAAELAMEQDLIDPETRLMFIAEPDNCYDQYAIQIWLPSQADTSITTNSSADASTDTHAKPGYLLGYVPRTMSKQLSRILQAQPSLEAEPTLDLKVVHRARMGKRIEIDCLLSLEQSLLPYLYLASLSMLSIQLHNLKRFTRNLFNRAGK